ncbi:dihydrofolate reductase family protein [Telmatospirillum sp. J64-1]|uniref:dihydrofolate reductase family protein n=1 Tax=Telmatospirillum sp. J64-1 TaxID=2502183 RepID=UPI00115E49FA|nr:dihydrofolate reductase family protein [Telmatospirillum sp. J64-1]
MMGIMIGPCFTVYIAASLDGFIATPDGNVGWLDSFETEDYGFEDFLAKMDAIVMGRTTYDQVLGFGWPYGDKPCYILTSQPLGPGAPPGVEAAGDAALLAKHLQDCRNVWVAGGAKTIRAFRDADAVDRIELFVMPILLGDGIRLFPTAPHSEKLTLEESKTYDNGAVKLTYRVKVRGI